MTDRPAVLRADYVDLKYLRGLKVCRLIFEVPQEHAELVTAVLGHPPMGATQVPVAIARLAPDAPAEPLRGVSPAEGPTASIPLVSPQEMREKKHFRELKRAAQAALKLDDPEFRKWLTAKHPGMHNELGSFDAVLKHALGIDSKTQLDSDPIAGERWDKLLASFDYRGRV